MKKIGLTCIIILQGILFSLCSGFFQGDKAGMKETNGSIPKLVLLPDRGTRSDLNQNPVRAYVTRDNGRQKSPCFILQVSGCRPGTRIYWSYRYEAGPYNPRKKPPFSPFLTHEKHGFNHWTDSTVADEKGESCVRVRTTTYAGDWFQFGFGLKQHMAGFKNEDPMSIRFRNNTLVTRPITIWKRIFLEKPKKLKNVSFSQETWKYVAQNLETLNIECQGGFEPEIIDPKDPRLFFYFYTRPDDQARGKGKDPRYGPSGYGPMEVMLSRINIMLSDQNKDTINILILGALSPKRDLIKHNSPDHQPPYPVQYDYQYQKSDLDLMEWLAYGSGLSMTGRSPAIIIWSDFWWLASKTIGVSHAKSLARVILHELGHHLLMFKTGGQEKILDSTGHLDSTLATTRKSMMTGCGILLLSKRGKPQVSSNAIRLERYFINNLYWHPKIQMLIRRDYIPRED